MSDADAALSEIERRLHRVLIEGVLATGEVPGSTALAATAGIDVAEVPTRLAMLAAADYLGLDPDGRVTCLYPFSPTPTPHVVVIGDDRRYAMCAIDALGIAAMLGQAVTIEGICAVCREPIRLDVEPGRIVRAEPGETVVVARRDRDTPAVKTCCPFTLFACGPAHGEEFAAWVSGTGVLVLDEALVSGETVFGDFLADVLPARRRRAPETRARERDQTVPSR